MYRYSTGVHDVPVQYWYIPVPTFALSGTLPSLIRIGDKVGVWVFLFKDPSPMQPHVETARTFCMYFNVASNFYYDFVKLLQNFSCENIFLLYLTFIKLQERFIKVLAAILSPDLLQVSLSSIYNFKSK